MNKFLSLLTGDWIAPVLASLGLAAALWAGYAYIVHNARAEGRAEVQKTCDRDKAILQGAADEALRANNVESNRRLAAQQGAIDAANQKIEQLLADVATSRTSHDGLQQRAAAVAARCDRTTSDPTAGPASSPAASPGRMLADVLGELDARAGRLAEYADRARAAGEACERSYDSLTATP